MLSIMQAKTDSTHSKCPIPMQYLFNKFQGHEKLMRNLAIFGVLVLAFLTRSYFWFYGYHEGDEHGLFIHGDGYWTIASAFDQNSDAGIFDHWRSPVQIVYPLYLAPIFIFGLDPSIYVFCLHHLFVAATALLIIVSGRFLGSWWVGILGGFVYASHLMIGFWFHFVLADTAFQFHAALFMYVNLLLWKGFRKKLIFPYIFAGLTLSFIRPEGFLVFAISILLTSIFILKRRFHPWKIIGVYAGIALLIVTVGLIVISTNKNVHDKVFSNVNVAWGLYYGSYKTPTNVLEVNEILIDMREYGRVRASDDPEGRSMWYWISMKGLERISAQPVTYLANSVERCLNALFPSFFREGVSWRYKFFDRAIMAFLLLGSMAALLSNRELTRYLCIGLILLGAGIYTMVAFYMSEWDVRVQLSAHVYLLPVASLGWVDVLCRLFGIYRPQKT